MEQTSKGFLPAGSHFSLPMAGSLILTHILQTEVKNKMSARKQGFAKRASLSRWFAILEDHHGSVED